MSLLHSACRYLQLSWLEQKLRERAGNLVIWNLERIVEELTKQRWNLESSSTLEDG